MSIEQMFLMFAMMHVASANKTDKECHNYAFFWMGASVVAFAVQWVLK